MNRVFFAPSRPEPTRLPKSRKYAPRWIGFRFSLSSSPPFWIFRAYSPRPIVLIPPSTSLSLFISTIILRMSSHGFHITDCISYMSCHVSHVIHVLSPIACHACPVRDLMSRNPFPAHHLQAPGFLGSLLQLWMHTCHARVWLICNDVISLSHSTCLLAIQYSRIPCLLPYPIHQRLVLHSWKCTSENVV